MITLQDCQALDAKDALRPLRDRFALPAGSIYLDGNSLGAQPKAAAARVAEVVTQEWGKDLITSWNKAGWITLPERLGNQFAPWIGVGEGELMFTDTTSINLYKVLSAAARIAREDAPGRKKLISERSNFPTDLYIAQCCWSPKKSPARCSQTWRSPCSPTSTTAPVPCMTWPPSRLRRMPRAFSASGTCATALVPCPWT